MKYIVLAGNRQDYANWCSMWNKNPTDRDIILLELYNRRSLEILRGIQIYPEDIVCRIGVARLDYWPEIEQEIEARRVNIVPAIKDLTFSATVSPDAFRALLNLPPPLI